VKIRSWSVSPPYVPEPANRSALDTTAAVELLLHRIAVAIVLDATVLPIANVIFKEVLRMVVVVVAINYVL